MKSRKHVKTVLFVAGMLAVGTTMGAALLIERHGGGSQAASGKQDQARGAVGRPAQSPVATSGLYGQASDPQDPPVALSNPGWSPPAFVPWPQGAPAGGGSYGWSTASYELPESYGHGRQGSEIGYNGTTYTIVGAGPDTTAATYSAFNRGTESAPSPGALFSAVPPALGSAPGQAADVSKVSLSVTPPVPEPAEWTMLVAGLLVIGVIARRRNRNNGQS